MGRSPRLIFPGAFYHIYNRGVDKQPIFHDDLDKNFFLRILAENIKNFELRLTSYCLMNNHFHLFIQITKENLSEAMQSIFYKFSSHMNSRYERVGPLFQGRYKDRLVNQNIYGKVLIRYIHQNPCEAALVKNPEDYPWSSYRSYLNLADRPEWLDVKGGLLFFGDNPDYALKDFIEFHSEPTDQSEKEKLSNFSRKRCLAPVPGTFLPF